MNLHSTIIRSVSTDDISDIAQFNIVMAQETEERQLDPETIQSGVSGVIQNHAHGFYLIAERDQVAVGSLLITFEWSDCVTARSGGFKAFMSNLNIGGRAFLRRFMTRLLQGLELLKVYVAFAFMLNRKIWTRNLYIKNYRCKKRPIKCSSACSNF